ncbi:MAG: helix-turn-helix domain-containing protein [Defluviitaleaceae bacterium]|nr:helix-turn-helix domain-containing protein [Defluviitaleaceae bacterium]
MFAFETGVTVAGYILKRRLDHALAEISSGKKAAGVVLEYGFETYAGFYKAFVKMYGCSPKKYLRICKSKNQEAIFMHGINEIKKILGNWNISTDLEVEDVTETEWQTGKKSEWTTWRVGDVYYLKTNERTKMIRNIKIAKALSDQGLASEFTPVQTKQGHDYVDGLQIFLLTKKIGEPLTLRPQTDDEIGFSENDKLRNKHAFKLGQAIAKLHRALKSVQIDVKPWEGNLYEQGKNAISIVKKLDLEIDEVFFSDYTENFGKLYEKLPKQLIHGNLCVEAAVYQNGEVAAFKGFETYNLTFPRIYDVTWCAGEISPPQIGEYLKTLTEMLKGYDSISPLTEEEKQSVYYVLCATYLKGYGYFTKTAETADLMTRYDKAMVYLAKNKGKFFGLM